MVKTSVKLNCYPINILANFKVFLNPYNVDNGTQIYCTHYMHHFIMFNHLSHIPTVTDINDNIIVPLVSEFSIPQSHTTTTNDVYPLLKSLNIDTNLNSKTNEEQIVNLFSELVYLFKSSGKDLNFIHQR